MAIFYITRDPERATGIEDMLDDYHVICPYQSQVTRALQDNGAGVFVLGEEPEGGTYGMIKSLGVQKYIAEHTDKHSRPHIIVLKNSALIEQACTQYGWDLWAPKAEIAKKYEDKISQYNALKNHVPFPVSYISTIKNIRGNHYPYILQFNTGHSGEGTHIVSGADDLEPIRNAFPDREARISKYVSGDTYTLNALLTRTGEIYTGSISLQLTGIPGATDNPSATVGNDFGVIKNMLLSSAIQEMQNITKTVGRVMANDGYCGLFGIDLIQDAEGSLFFIEVNTHQPASISFEARIHRQIGATPLILMFIRDMMEEKSLQNANPPPPVFPHFASQIIYRNTKDMIVASLDVDLPDNKGVLPTRMDNIKPGEELFRVQFYGHS